MNKKTMSLVLLMILLVSVSVIAQSTCVECQEINRAWGIVAGILKIPQTSTGTSTGTSSQTGTPLTSVRIASPDEGSTIPLTVTFTPVVEGGTPPLVYNWIIPGKSIIRDEVFVHTFPQDYSDITARLVVWDPDQNISLSDSVTFSVRRISKVIELLDGSWSRNVQFKFFNSKWHYGSISGGWGDVDNYILAPNPDWYEAIILALRDKNFADGVEILVSAANTEEPFGSAGGWFYSPSIQVIDGNENVIFEKDCCAITAQEVESIAG